MGNKKLVIAIIVVIILIAGLIGGYFYLQKSTEQAKVLQEEATKLSQTDLKKEEIDMEIKSTGKYAIVEETMKNYLNDIRNLYLELENTCNDDAVSQIISAENIEADPEELTVVKEKIEEYSQQIDDNQSKLDSALNEENIMNAIEEKNLRNYYNDIYENVMLDERTQENLKSVKESIKDDQDEIWAKIDALNEVADFLVENTRYWEISDGKIQFTNVNKLTEYYELLNGTM